MPQNRRSVQEKVVGKAGELAAKAEARGLSTKHAAEVRDEMRARGEKVLGSSVESTRHAVAGARRNKVRMAVTGAAAAVVAVLLAGWGIVRRRR
jgi:urease accessory protein UreF